MPPRTAPARGNAPRGGGHGRGRGATRGGLPVGLSIASHVKSVGVKRPGFGTAGKSITVTVNAFETTIPDSYIYHYDDITPDKLPARVNMQLIKALQCEVAVQVFTPPAVYDGRKNMYATRRLPLGDAQSQEFSVALGAAGSNPSTRPPKIYKIKITLVAEINPELLQGFIEGKQTQDNAISTALMALNVAIRMEPNQKYPFNVRSFYPETGKRAIGSGIELWRGFFQSVRPTMGRMIINIDISTAAMYKSGSLIDLCLQFLGKTNVNALAPRSGLPAQEINRLQRFLSGLNICTPHTPGKRRTIKKLSTSGANGMMFSTREGARMSVADYFKNSENRPLRYPDVICVEVASGALLPLELCEVPAGQFMRKQLPEDKTKDMVEFSTLKPQERLAAIRSGLELLSHGQSRYVREFGIAVTPNPLQLSARVLNPPKLKYGPGSKQPTIAPFNGQWNMVDKKFVKPSVIHNWVVVIYEREARFERFVQEMVKGFVDGCKSVGMQIRNENPVIRWESGHGDINKQLLAAGAAAQQQMKVGPTIIVVILPDNGNEIYTAVKHFGDVVRGVPTQCLKATKCSRAKMQFWANVMLKVNAKLGGINVIPDPGSVVTLSDPLNPTMIIGADVIHPAPGSDGRPSFTSLVGSVDSNSSLYVATSRVQTGRQEIIADLQDMTRYAISKYIDYRRVMEKAPSPPPKRIIFYRDGVSEGQFQQVLDLELPMIQAACTDLKIKPKITLIIVGKRHHFRFFPGAQDADRSGNCPAGTTIDQGLGHPVENDYYQLTHGGLLGTSRPAHYSVLYDDNQFNADTLQALSFALCHVYARSTRSVSIPAPVYYADIVCARAKNHYDPNGRLKLSDTATNAESELEAFKNAYLPLHANQATKMYFM